MFAEDELDCTDWLVHSLNNSLSSDQGEAAVPPVDADDVQVEDGDHQADALHGLRLQLSQPPPGRDDDRGQPRAGSGGLGLACHGEHRGSLLCLRSEENCFFVFSPELSF